jgi:hypothetical protein
VCFSAEADLLAGVVVGGIGVDAWRHAHRPAEKPLAAIPLVLAGHQLIEVFVWWGLQDRVPESVEHLATWLYLAIAFGVLPVLVPIAVGALEPLKNQRRVRWFTALGTVVAIILMYSVVRGPIEATLHDHYIAYHVDLWHGGTIVLFYVIATCGSMLVSKHDHVRWFGVINLIAAGLLAWLNKNGFISLWCVWAAITSIAIAVHLRYAEQQQPPQLASTQ